MSLFQPNVVAQYIATLDYDKVAMAYSVYKAYFLNPEKQENIRHSKEEQFQEGFLRELFVDVLGYTLNPTPNFNLRTEEKNVTDSKKADGAILINNEVVGVIELKGCNTTDLKKVETQAFGYKNQHRGATYVIISNFEKLRFYIDNSVDFEEFNLFNLSEDEFSLLYLCLAHENIEKNLPKTIKTKSVSKEEEITNKLYKDYSEFKQALFNDILVLNQVDTAEQKLVLFRKTQKLLDRLLFIFFAEDSGLLSPNTMKSNILDLWFNRSDYETEEPLYNRIKKYFTWLNEGFKGRNFEVFAYNGGLFKPDEVLDNLTISDDILYKYTLKLSEYNYASEVDVNILGHIFEHSLTEIEEVTNTLLGNEQPTVSKRKKDGVFYTPQYITKYIVENTVGKLCAEKKAEMEIDEEEYFSDKKRYITTKRVLIDKLNGYREWLLGITICDPACGSGAFLNAALQFLINEHKLIDEMQTKITGGGFVFPNIENVILENNLYGVDINEESVEIAKLALWLRTAQPHRKLSSLNNNIKCGNSLISDVEVAGDKAFNWEAEFPQVFEKGGFDVVIGNPPYVDSETMIKTIPLQREYIANNYDCAKGNWDLFIAFIEKSTIIAKQNAYISLIIPNKLIAAKYATEIRKLIAQKHLFEIVDYSNVCIFEEASVYPCIISVKNNSSSSKVSMICMHSIDTIAYINSVSNEMLTEGLYWDKFFFSPKTVSIIDKIDKHPKMSSFLPNINGAATVAEAYLIKEKLVDNKDLANSKKLINTGTIDRYASLWGYSNTQYIKGKYSYPKISDADILGISSNRLRQSQSPKLIIAGMCLGYEAYYDSGQYIAGKSTTVIVGDSEKLKFAQTIINSSLLSFWLKVSFNSLTMSGGYFNIGTNEVSMIPIPMCENITPYIEKSDIMQELNNKLLRLRSKFLRILQTNFEVVKITGALQVFDEKEFSDFISELRKQKIVLSLRQQDEWEEYFNDYKRQCNELSAQISSTDKEIDRMVYALYDLTEEEIDIVEGYKWN
ncbi:MAG: Eco57I restriction-modification methylase domain-containing protein [Bacteroidales bacterium]|nr:Eco57I restriction-modification methylase domain-containing protein [Bacteroidales bacterium]